MAIQTILGTDVVKTTGLSKINSNFSDLDTRKLNKHTGKTTAPTASDDTGSGYEVSDIWLDETNDKAYICLDNTASTAVWIEITSTGPLGKYDATTAPTTGDDSGDGYSVGSIWVNVTDDDAYICVDATVATAVWEQINGGGGGGGATEIRVRIPGEMIADTSGYQGVFWKNNTGGTITISNVQFSVAIAAAGTGAACAFNVYKSSGTASDGINTSAVNLFTTAVDLGTANDDLTNVPNTTTVESGRWVSLRVTSSAGATNKASDAEVIITYS